MTKRKRQRTEMHGEVERVAALLDVHLLDTLAELESLLRGGRIVQRESLRIRGVRYATTNAQRAASAGRLQKVVAEMQRDYRSLGGVLGGLHDYAADLNRAVRTNGSSH